MPTIALVPLKAYAHCRNAMCSGYEQVEVDGVRETASYTYGEMGGDDIFKQFTQNSIVEFKFANPDDAPCPSCEQPREVSGEPRPSYQPMSGHDPMGLLSSPKFDPQRQAARVEHIAHSESDEEMEVRLRQQIKEEQMMAKLRGEA